MFWALVYIINSVDKTKCRVHLIISKRVVSRIKKNYMEILRLLILRAHHAFDLRWKKSIFFFLISLLVKTILGTYKHILCLYCLLFCKITRQSKPFLRALFPLSFSCSYPPVHSGEEQRYPYVLGWYLCIWKDNCCTCGMNVLPKEMNKNTVTSFQVCCWMLVVVFLKTTTSLKWTNL